MYAIDSLKTIIVMHIRVEFFRILIGTLSKEKEICQSVLDILQMLNADHLVVILSSAQTSVLLATTTREVKTSLHALASSKENQRNVHSSAFTLSHIS